MKKTLLALLVLFLLKAVLANEDELSLPFQLPIFGEYSNQMHIVLLDNVKVNVGEDGKLMVHECCSDDGWCGTTPKYCAPRN
ncbi:hypothetical protein MTR67_015210 [Solanum verrucosum]|uniref:Chitin-binding type-1 domain-containing protein n=1 Tax=Solanum verrucosum TaxID=315347 RepID=A0AAF0QIC5_SOLVR|nr:hypothetical protein MTR67_015210 [Solanum verrucosum]